MSIPVLCACGKAMRAPAEWAGRDAKCPACGQMVHIPGAGGPAKPMAVNKPPVVPCPDCGKPLLVPPGMAGKLVACPSCGGHVTLPGAKTAAGVSARPPAAKVAAGRPKSNSQLHRQPAESAKFEPATFEADDDRDLDDDDDFRESRRGRKKKSKKKSGARNLLLIGGLVGGGVLGLALIGALIWIFARSGGASGSLAAMVPADADSFGVIHLGEFLKTPSGQKIRKMVEDMNPKKDANLASDLEKVRDIAFFTRGDKWLAFMSFKVPADIPRIEKESANTHDKKVHEGKTLLVSKNGVEPSILIHDSFTAILGSEQEIIAYLKQPPAAAGPMAGMLRTASSDGAMMFVGFQASVVKKAGGMAPMPMAPGMIPDFQSGQLRLTDGSKLTGDLSVEFADAAKATAAKQSLDDALGMARTAMPQMKAMKVVPEPMFDLGEKALAKMRPTQNGNVVVIPIEIDSSLADLVEKAKALGPAMMMGGMPGMGGPGIGPGPGQPGIPQPKMPPKKKIR